MQEYQLGKVRHKNRVHKDFENICKTFLGWFEYFEKPPTKSIIFLCTVFPSLKPEGLIYFYFGNSDIISEQVLISGTIYY